MISRTRQLVKTWIVDWSTPRYITVPYHCTMGWKVFLFLYTCIFTRYVWYPNRTHAIIGHGLYILYPIFHFIIMVSIKDSLCIKNGNICSFCFRVVSNQERIIMADVQYSYSYRESEITKVNFTHFTLGGILSVIKPIHKKKIQEKSRGNVYLIIQK